MDYQYVENGERFKKLLCTVFSESFMKEYTNFDCFADFKASSAVFVNWDAPVLAYSKQQLDNFVKESTQFENWDAMVIAATEHAFPQ